MPNAAEAGRVSQEAVPIEQGQPLRAVEPDEWALKVKAKPIPEIPTQRQRDIHELTHLSPVPWCPACVSGKAADDLHRRRQDTKDSGLDVDSFDHCDISAEDGMFNKKLKFKDLLSHRSGVVAALEGPKDVTEHVVRFVCDMLETWGCGVCVLKCQNEPAEIALQNASRRGNSRRFRGTRPGVRKAVWVTVNQLSKRWRNRHVQRYFKCTLITTATVTSFPSELPIFLGWSDTLRGRSHGTQSKLMDKCHFSS